MHALISPNLIKLGRTWRTPWIPSQHTPQVLDSLGILGYNTRVWNFVTYYCSSKWKDCSHHRKIIQRGDEAFDWNVFPMSYQKYFAVPVSPGRRCGLHDHAKWQLTLVDLRLSGYVYWRTAYPGTFNFICSSVVNMNMYEKFRGHA